MAALIRQSGGPAMTEGRPSAASAQLSVRDLQQLAQGADLRPRRKRPLSRAARLQLIDILSRWSGSGLALIAGVAIFVAISAGRAYPFRAAVWTLMVLAALYVCRRLAQEFRSGARSASRPFRWRADYTAALSVLGAAFGAGAVIVLPRGAPAELAFQSIALLAAASLGAGAIHSAHGRSAIAASLPAALFIFLGAWTQGGLALAFWGVGGAATTGALALVLFHRYLRGRAASQFPRTGYARRNFGAKTDLEPAHGVPESSGQARQAASIR